MQAARGASLIPSDPEQVERLRFPVRVRLLFVPVARTAYAADLGSKQCALRARRRLGLRWWACAVALDGTRESAS